ncbi:MAG: adenylate/guanylate cyclase domain-containing protein, partial [Ilumatobacteraceae bacterium]
MKGTQESGVSRVTTFLFTDIEGSTRLWEAYPAEMSSALRHHDEVVRAAIESNAGLVFKTVGDAFCAAFASPSSAIAAAFSAQHALLHAQWPVDSTIRVRMAIHTGECERRDNDFFGPTVNRVARLLAIGHGGQTLVSGVTADLVTDRLAGGASLMALGEHRLKDLERSERVFQLNVPGLETIFPALLSLNNSALRHNLSIQPSSFVGRQRQIAEIRDLVTRAPLTTLTGPGGTGKTRLAMQVAAELLDGSADGVWFVDLASVTDSTGLATAVAAVFGVREEIHRRTANKIIEHLRDRELLLVLDNCEHLINDVARFAADILRSCGKVAILTTSREPLQIDGEHLYRVPPLTVPPRGSNKDDEVYDSEAAQLFLERARQHDRDFGLRAGEVPLIAQVCQRLDGIPLAMELAAARLRTMSLADLHQRLDDLFSLLNAGSRAALPRHQTLRAVIDWSYESLSRSEQIALQRLSVFPSSWTLTAARDVIVGGEVDQANFDGLHDALVLKSLVQLQDSTSGSRYRLLDTVRVYADERLCEMGPQSAVGVRRRYVECCRALAATEEPGGNRRPERLEVLNDDLDNLRTALGFSIELDLTDPGLTIVHALLNVTFRPALLSDLDLLLERAGPPWSALHVDTMLWHTYVMSSSNRSVRPKYLDQALAIAESLDDSTRIAYCLAAMASEHLRTGDVIAQLSVANSAVEAA